MILKKNKPRVLFWDIETSFNVVAAFSLYNDYAINHRNILQERHLISVSWKWQGDKEVHSVSIADNARLFAEDPHNDYHVLLKIEELFREADVVIHHYGDKFDLPMVNARLAFHNIAPLPPVITIDTKKLASRHFRFNSNRIDYLAQFFGFGKKIDTDPALWLRCLRGERKAIKEMIEYNKHDVVLLEKVYERLAPFVPARFNRNLLSERPVCPSCGSIKLHKHGTRKTTTREYDRYQCQSCGKWSSGTKATRKVEVAR